MGLVVRFKFEGNWLYLERRDVTGGMSAQVRSETSAPDHAVALLMRLIRGGTSIWNRGSVGSW